MVFRVVVRTTLGAQALFGSYAWSRHDWLCAAMSAGYSIRQPDAALDAVTKPSLTPGAGENSALSRNYDSFSSNYDDLDGGQWASALGIKQIRENLISRARGRSLEVGVGTGLNLPFYDPSKILSLDLVDLSDGMLQVIARKANHSLLGAPQFECASSDEIGVVTPPSPEMPLQTLFDADRPGDN